MKIQSTTVVWVSAIPLWLLIDFAQKNPKIVEEYYSGLLYPIFFDLHQTFLQWIPFSIGDLLYLALALFFFLKAIKKIPYWRVKPIQIIRDFGALMILLLWLFHLSWGFNYHRLPLNEQLKTSIKYSEQDLEYRLDQIIEKSNHWHQQLAPADSQAVTFPFSSKQINDIVVLHHPLGQESITPFSNVKKSIWSLPLSYMGYAGYLNPFTLESQVNAKMPVLSLITTSLHEMAHQLGYASEKEANFIAYLSAIHSDNPYVQFAGNTFAFRYLFSELYRLDADKANEKLKKLRPGILKNLREINNFWKQYDNPFEVVFDKTYDRYLKANGQKSGLQSYNEMVGLVINHHKKHH
jgi:hypothetical protein